MHAALYFLAALGASVASVQAGAIDAGLNTRQTDCEKQYGTYPPYTGPCESKST